MSNITENTAFNLSVIKPVRGQRGEVMFEATIHAESVSAAVKRMREEIAGSGWIVVQTAALQPQEPEVPEAIEPAQKSV